MSELATVGIDLAKSVFQIHGIDENGRVLVLRPLRRSQLLSFFEKQLRCRTDMERGKDIFVEGSALDLAAIEPRLRAVGLRTKSRTSAQD